MARKKTAASSEAAKKQETMDMNDCVESRQESAETTDKKDSKKDKGNTGSLKDLTAQWMQLERKTLEQRRKAALFYDEYLMKPIEEEYIRNNQDMVFENVEYMVVSVGTSYEPIVLDIQLLKPGKLLFLYTEESHDTMAKVIEYCVLSPTRYDKSIVSEVDPMDIYREIRVFTSGPESRERCT